MRYVHLSPSQKDVLPAQTQLLPVCPQDWMQLFQLWFEYPISLCGQMSPPIVRHAAGSSR